MKNQETEVEAAEMEKEAEMLTEPECEEFIVEEAYHEEAVLNEDLKVSPEPELKVSQESEEEMEREPEMLMAQVPWLIGDISTRYFPLPNMTFSISEVLLSQSCTLMIITFSKLNTVPAFGYEVDGISTARSIEGAWPARL